MLYSFENIPSLRLQPGSRTALISDSRRGTAAVLAGILVAAVAGWLIAVHGMFKISYDGLSWSSACYVAMLGALPQVALAAGRRSVAAWRSATTLSAPLAERRYHGSLAAVVDCERRPLRPIGLTAREVAARTGVILDELVVNPGVRIFRGLRSGADQPTPITHAICAGRSLILIESVAWPPGRYRVDQLGYVSCDGRPIGQSISPLTAALRHWRQRLPRGHEVSALVIVHRAGVGGHVLPAACPESLTWVLAENALQQLAPIVARRGGSGRAVDRSTLVALIEATVDQPPLTQ